MSVLIVEDDDDEMELMVRALKDHGVKFYKAKTIQQAFDVLEDHIKEIRVICLDLHLGHEHGFEFLSWRDLSPVYKGIPVVITTSSADIPTIKIALTKGANDYLIKPVESSTFVDLLKDRGIIPKKEDTA